MSGAKTVKRILAALAQRTDAQGLLEYAVIVAVIAIACFATMVLLGHTLSNTFGLQNKVSGF
jgi:Flp pilus assembly pilin Flp